MPQAVHLGICLHDVICLIQWLPVIENSILCRFLICRILSLCRLHRYNHPKVLTYVEYRVVSGVFQNIDSLPTLHPASVSSHCTKGGGVHTHQGGEGGGVNILEDARHWRDIGLVSYSIIPLRI
jgi:hypothetical protein